MRTKTKTKKPRRASRVHPERFGPEWWAIYAARFSAAWTDHVLNQGFDAADRMRSLHAESAAACADRGILAFHEAKNSEAIEVRGEGWAT